MRQRGAADWSLVHGFFVNMGGFVLHANGPQPLPLRGETLLELVALGLIDIPTVTRDEILDRSKADDFAKVFTAFQVTWMVTKILARLVARLCITPFEVLTATYIIVSSLTFALQWSKPKDVAVPVVIRCPVQSPDPATKRIALAAHLVHFLFTADTRPRYVFNLYLAICGASGLYIGLHTATRPELLAGPRYNIWRISCYISLGLVLVLYLFILTSKWIPGFLFKPLFLVFCLIYAITRLVPFIIGIEVFFSSLPVCVYHDVSWTNFIPHF